MLENSPPETFNGNINALPAALLPLCEKNQWLVWRWKKTDNGKWTKPPFQARFPGRLARNNDPTTWSSHAEAAKAVKSGVGDGIGFALTNTEIAAVDLDHCRDPESGRIDAWACDIIGQAPGAYLEITVSGTGLRIVGTATGEETHTNYEVEGRDGAKVELFRSAVRYITVSGLQIGECNTLPNIDDLVDFLKTERPHQKPRAPSQKPLVFNQIDCAKRGINDLIKNGAPERQRSEVFQSVVWRMANAGLSIDEIEQALAKYPNGIAQKYASRLREEVERSHDKWRVAGGMAASGANADPDEPQPWDDPDTSILDDRRGELPDFPLDALSPAAADWVSRAALGAGVTDDHVAVPLLGIVSSLIGTARRVMPSRSWTEPLTLWTAIVGFSGSGKTPGISATKRALALVERERKNWIDNLRRAHEAKVEAAKIARDTWKEELKKTVGATVVSLDEYRAAKAGEPSPMPAEAVDPGPFVAPRLYVTNITIEKLTVLLQGRPQGMLLVADELAALFLNMSRYSSGQDNEFWLEAWCGGPYRVERMQRPAVHIDHLLVGLVGGLQPDKLARSFTGDMDGMYARVIYSWPRDPKYRRLTDEVAEIEPEIVNALKRIADMEAGQDQDGGFAPRAVQLSQAATEHFEHFRQFLHDLKQGRTVVSAIGLPRDRPTR